MRNFCSSRQAKRSVLFAEKPAPEILAPVPHHHWTFSIPRVLRGPFERERSLPGLLSQTAYASILKTFQALLGRKMETTPDPRTGAPSIVPDPLEWIHRIASHIPDPRRHCQRFYGAYSKLGRISAPSADADCAGLPARTLSQSADSDAARQARSSWARLIKKILEADPLLCPCGRRMRIVSFVTDPRVVDRILRHRESGRCKTPDPFEPRPHPAASAKFPQ